MRLPTLPRADRIRQSTQTVFGGLNHTAGASDGDIYDEANLWSGEFPKLSVRPPRVTYQSTYVSPNGLFNTDHNFIAAGTKIYADGVEAGAVENSRKVFAALGTRILIWPDKKVLIPPVAPAETWTLESLEASYTATGLVFSDGTYAGEAAAKNTITTAGDAFPFKVGDAVTIPACTPTANEEVTYIIREISGDGKVLRFYDNTFAANGTVSGSLTLSRNAPDLDWLCVNENRVWGCKGDTIYASKLGDPYNWNVFDGLSTDSWSWDTGTAGDFTGCVSFMGYPCFFKENQIFKIYGDRPTNFQAMGSPDLGVMSGCGRSLAVANETLFYLSRAGVVAYTGGLPRIVGTELGVKLKNGTAGSDGLRYYLYAEDEPRSSYRLFVYDALRRVWHKEASFPVLDIVRGIAEGVDVLSYTTLGITSVAILWTTNTAASGARESDVGWMAELGDYTLGSPNKKHVTKLLLRLELPEGSRAAAAIRYDGRGDWVTAASLTAEAKRSEYLAVVPRRCDHFRLKLTGTGPCILHSLTVETAEGSPNKL